jgi:hypothetical protein
MDVVGMLGNSPDGVPVEIKEWEAIMAYLQALPVSRVGDLPVIPTDDRANETRAIKAG